MSDVATIEPVELKPVLNRYNAESMLTNTTDQLKAKLRGKFILVFPDGEIETTGKETIYSSYAWDAVRRYPKTKLSKKFHVTDILKGERLGNSTHLKLLSEVICWGVMEAYRGDPNGPTKMELAELTYDLTNVMYNDFVRDFDEHVVSIDILDFIEIMEFPTVKAANESVTPITISQTYDVIKYALKKEPALANNPISIATRAGLVREGQVLQSLGPVGFITDIDSFMFNQPILRSFAQGLRKFHDSLILSRDASRSHFFATEPLKDAEYSARKLQIVNMIIENLHPGDCGSRHYLRWRIRDAVYNDKGKEIRKADLKLLDGKIYLDEDTGTYKVLRPWDKHLLGKEIKMRSPVAGCNHPDPYGICETCFGDLSNSIVSKTNLGHLCSASMNAKASQLVMSVKHYVGNAEVDAIVVPPEYKKFLEVSEDGSSWRLHHELEGKNIKLVVAAADVPGITDIMNVEKVSDLLMSHISEIDTVGLLYTQDLGNGKEIEQFIFPIPVAVDRRKASMSFDFMEHIREYRPTFNERGNFVFDLSAWDPSKNMLSLPLRQFNMSDHAKAITAAIESSKAKQKERAIMSSPEVAVEAVYDLVNSRLDVNLALLEVIVLGTMVVSVEDRNYNVPKGGETKGLGVTAVTIPNRSMSGAMAYEKHVETMMTPSSFFRENRPSSPLDVCFKPFEVMEDEKIPWDYNSMR